MKPSSIALLPLSLLAVFAGGCEILDRPQSTHFERTTGGFRFRAIADAAYPEGSANGEAQRMSWLARDLKASGTCPDGYTITSRQAELAWHGQLADVYNVTYEGRCKSG
jgi:hypothetical protein